MTALNRGRLTTRRMLVAGALATVLVLIGAAVLISRAPSAQLSAVSAPKPIVPSEPAPMANIWAKLTAAEQATLQPLQGQWANLDPAAKAHWIRVADRLHGRPSRAVARVAQHLAAWQQLSPAERAQARLHYKMASRLSPAERKRRWDTYQASLHPTLPMPHDTQPAVAVVSPSAPTVESGVTVPRVTEVPSSLRVRAVGTNTPASSAAAGDAS
jgi:hypothetical protein